MRHKWNVLPAGEITATQGDMFCYYVFVVHSERRYWILLWDEAAKQWETNERNENSQNKSRDLFYSAALQ